MRNVVLSSLSGVFVMAIVVLLLSLYGRRHSKYVVEVAEVREPRSNVQVLTTAEQIEDVARRAAVFERALAASAIERAVHYETVAADQKLAMFSDDVHSLPNNANRCTTAIRIKSKDAAPT